MKGDVSAVMVPADAVPDDEAETSSKVPEESGDVLLGNAFDAFQDGDREGFIRSMKAFLAE